VGVPDEKYGEELMAWIRLREGAERLDAAAVREFCSGRLTHYKIPRYVLCVDAFPMTVTGKVRKVEMREQRAGAAAEGTAVSVPHLPQQSYVLTG
jgi:fatty-acyl-CoA synthase